MGRDPYALTADFASHLRAQELVDATWQHQSSWQRMSLLTMPRSGFFSSDRAIRSYAEHVWNVSPCPVHITCPIPS